MALGQFLGQSNPNQSGADKYLRPEVKADRDVINHIWASINDLHDRATAGQIHISNLDDFADILRQDYGVCAEIVGKGNNFRFSQVGSSKISTGAHLSRHLEKMTGKAENAIPSITGKYICDQFGLESARRSSVERQESSLQQSSSNSVSRARQRFQLGASLPPPILEDTDGFDNLSDDLSGDDDGSVGGDSFTEDGLFLSDAAVDEAQQTATAPSQLLVLDVDSEDDSSEGKPFGETSKSSSSQSSPQEPPVSIEPPLASFDVLDQRSSDGSQPPRPPRHDRGLRQERDPIEAMVADAASTFSGLANGSTDGVTVVADASEVIAVAAAATMLGIDAVRQIQHSRDQRYWERLVALGQNIQATEERSDRIAERIVKAEEVIASNRNSQGRGQDRVSTQPRERGQSPSAVAAASRLETQATQVNAMDDQISVLGQPDPTSKRLRAPKLEANAPISKRLDALEAYLSNINQKLDSIEERLEILEKDAGISTPAKDVIDEHNRSATVSARNSASQPTPNQESQFGRFVGNIVGQRKPKISSQSQA